MPRTRKIPLPDGSSLDAEIVGFRANTENWNDYILDDGSLIRMKLVVTEVLRVEGQYDQVGNPAYIVNSTNVVSVDSPEELKRG